MAASASDYFMKTAMSTATTMSSPGYTVGNTTINVGSTANYPSDTGFMIGVDEVDGNGERVAGTYNIFRCIVASATQFSGVVYVGGDANRNYSASSSTRVYLLVSHARENRLVDGLLVSHDQDGTLKAGAVDNAGVIADGIISETKFTTSTGQGWFSTGGTHSVSTGYNSGNRSFEIATSTDLSGIVSEGMRYRVTRNTTPPTQCADLEASSSHYASKASPTGITFTDDFTCEAWVKLESYNAADEQVIVSRFNSNGWIFRLSEAGQLQIFGQSTSADEWTSYQSIPLGKWVHVAATLDVSGNASTMWIDGVSVPNSQTVSGGGSITQAGDLQIGARTGSTEPFDGKLADVRVWSDIRTETEIQDNMYAYPSDTTGLVAHFKLNGDFTDSSSNGNNLTAQNSAVATNADNPWNATEYGIITAVDTNSIQVFCPEGYGIPNETLTAPYYSTQSAPYGFPRNKGKWEINIPVNSTASVTSSWANTGSISIVVPLGAWNVGCNVTGGGTRTNAAMEMSGALSESTSAVSSGYEETIRTGQAGSTATGTSSLNHSVDPHIYKEYTAPTTVYFIAVGTLTTGSLYNSRGNIHRIYAECAYL